MSLEEIRKNIDLVDSKILKFLNYRMELVLMANKFKAQIEDKEREKQLLERIKKTLADLIKPEFTERSTQKSSRKAKTFREKIIS